MKKTSKKVISLVAVFAMAASTSVVAFADTDPNTIVANDTAGGTTVTLDVASQFPSGLYTVQIPANVDLKYDAAATDTAKKWKNDPNTDVVKLVDDLIMVPNSTLSVTLDSSSITMTNADSSRTVDCACSMETFEVEAGADDALTKQSKVTFTAPNPTVAEVYTGTANFTVGVTIGS